MSAKSLKSSLLELNIAILFMSTSGVLGRFIDLPTPITIGLRTLFAAIILVSFCKWKKFKFHYRKKDLLPITIGALLLGLHWMTYFYSLQLSSVAVGMLSLFTYPAITSILEPLVRKTKLLPFHVFLSGLVLVGIYLLVPALSFEDNTTKAVGYGVFSAFCYAIRNIIMKEKVTHYNGSMLMATQMMIISVLLIPSYFLLDSHHIIDFLPPILILALATTAIGHTLFLYSFKNFSTVSASIISCAQPVYGIIIGMFLLNEYPNPSTLVGGGIIILTIIAESIRIYYQEKKSTLL